MNLVKYLLDFWLSGRLPRDGKTDVELRLEASTEVELGAALGESYREGHLIGAYGYRIPVVIDPTMEPGTLKIVRRP